MSKSINIYTTLAKSYSNVQLQNIIDRANEYPKIQVDACKAELLNRNIDHIAQNLLDEGEIQLLVFDVKKELSASVPLKECKDRLKEKGLTSSQIDDIINIATRKPAPEVYSPYKNKDYYGIQLTTGLFILFLVLKLIRCSQGG